MRIFVGIELEDYVKEALDSVRKNVQSQFVKGRFTLKNNYHLTLEFLGELDLIELDKLCDAVKYTALSTESFTIELGQLGYFTKKNRKILWAGISGGSDNLQSLHDSLKKRLARNGFTLEQLPYKAHITLGRQLQLKDESLSAQALYAVEPLHIEVKEIAVFESKRVDDVLVYAPVKKYGLTQ